MLNPQISPGVPSSYVRENGFVLTNDYHRTATILHQNEQYQLCAVITVAKSGELVFDTENLEDCWKEIDTEEEFRNAPFSWGTAHYSNAAEVVEAVTGKKENVLVEYKKIIARAKEEQRQKNTQILQERPKIADFIHDPNDEYFVIFNHKGREFVLSTRLPKKKGTVDDIFVFQKKKN